MFFPRRVVLALTASLAAAGPVLAQGPVRTPRVHALTGARVVVSPTSTLEPGTIIVRDGVIEAVGAHVDVPPDARIWPLDSLTVYPGLIDLAHAVSPPASGDDEQEGIEDLGHELDSVHPDRVLADALPLTEADRNERRSQGILTVRVLPGEGIFRGQAAVLNLGGGPLPDNLLERTAGQVAAFAPGEGYPNSLMGAVAVIRQTLSDSRWHREAHRIYGRRPGGRERPAFNAALAALEPVAMGEEPIIWMADDVLDILRAAEMGREMGIVIEYVGSGEEYKRLDEVRAATTRLVVPVNFPEAPDVGDPGEGLSVSLEMLRAWDERPRNPARLHEAGFLFALTAHGGDLSGFRARVRKAIDEGLPEEVALAALTTRPAEMLGMSDRLGTIERGKIANLVVADGDLFAKETGIRSVWVDGDRHEIEEIKPPIGDPRGTWDMVARDPNGQTYPHTLLVEGEVGALAARIMAMGQEIPASATQSGTMLIVTWDASALGASGEVRMSIEIDGDQARGSGSGGLGSFSLRGTRTAKPEGLSRERNGR